MTEKKPMNRRAFCKAGALAATGLGLSGATSFALASQTADSSHTLSGESDMTASYEIINAVQGFFESSDNNQRATTESLMSTPFHLDYSSFGAGPAADLNPADILNGWSQFLPGFDHTHHQLSPMVLEITGDTAKARVYVTATHFIAEAEGGELWTVYGSYDIGLKKTETGWILSGLVFHYKFQSGNGTLPALAQARAAEKSKK
ncbi:nuclear transport factor 2 family protein [Kiloniella sp. b19]|uniref:nuclear transport factor 2 family protein n=1 Tax=Kiloniella sp. GXU_MW_B19 TaxID=3141326 RepID=UPI0031DACC14